MTTEQLLSLKEDIDEAKDRNLQLQGQKEAIMQQLKEVWNCSTVKQAQKKLEELQNQIDSYSEKIEKGTEELEEKLHNESD